jgi:hypothetical protein
MEKKTVGALVALAALLLVGLAGSASGSDGDRLVLGQDNESTQTTTLTQVDNGGNGTLLRLVGHADAPTLQVETTWTHNDGYAILAQAPYGGKALLVDGPAYFSTSGLAKIPAGARSVTISREDIDPSMKVLVTVQGRGGDAVGARAGEGTITFRHTATDTLTRVAWFAIVI